MTITRAQTTVFATGDPATATITQATAGNLLVVSAIERSGNSHTTIAISDNGNNSGWTKQVAMDTLLGDTQARRTFIVWEKVVADGETLSSVTVNGPAEVRISVDEFEDSLGGNWAFQQKSEADTGTGSTSPLNTGSTPSVSDGELLLYSTAGWREGTGGIEPIDWANDNANTQESIGGNNGRTLAVTFGYTTTGGTKSNEVSWSGTGHEANAAILVFEAAGAVVEKVPSRPFVSRVSIPPFVLEAYNGWYPSPRYHCRGCPSCSNGKDGVADRRSDQSEAFGHAGGCLL